MLAGELWRNFLPSSMAVIAAGMESCNGVTSKQEYMGCRYDDIEYHRLEGV
jgi:hypothetical protein